MAKDIIDIYLKKTGQTFNELMSGASFYGIDKIELIIREEALPQNKKIKFYYANDHDLECDIVSYKLIPIKGSEIKLFEFGVDGGGACVYKLKDGSIEERGSSGGILDEPEDPIKEWKRFFENWELWWDHFENTHKNWIYFCPLFINDDIKSFMEKKVSSYKVKGKTVFSNIELWKRLLVK